MNSDVLNLILEFAITPPSTKFVLTTRKRWNEYLDKIYKIKSDSWVVERRRRRAKLLRVAYPEHIVLVVNTSNEPLYWRGGGREGEFYYSI